MTLRRCPCCTRNTLFQTGAYWACGACGYAVTHSALVVDEARAKSGEGGRRSGVLENLRTR